MPGRRAVRRDESGRVLTVRSDREVRVWRLPDGKFAFAIDADIERADEILTRLLRLGTLVSISAEVVRELVATPLRPRRLRLPPPPGRWPGWPSIPPMAQEGSE